MFPSAKKKKREKRLCLQEADKRDVSSLFENQLWRVARMAHALSSHLELTDVELTVCVGAF